MKRIGNLYPDICTFQNLYQSAKQAQRGKRYKPNVLVFNYCLETELLQLLRELQDKSYCPGEYRTFHLTSPKSRLISAAPYRDRIVHHALCNVIVPIFDRTFIHRSYANRKGFGTHKALRQFIQYSRCYKYILQCDIKKYFPSIDHLILKELIYRKIKCKDTLWLIDLIINNSNQQDPSIEYFAGDNLLTPIVRRKGLPIGNLTSQFFSNIYLNGLDHFILETLKIPYYLRYVDDFALFSNAKSLLQDARVNIEQYLEQVRLKIHPIKSQLFETRHGASFLGFRVLPNQIRVRSNNLQRGRRRLKHLTDDYQQGKITLEQVNQSLQSWIAHLNHGDTLQLQKQIFSSLVFTRS